MGLLDGKVAIVTGAGRGIGRSHAVLLASEGASVVVNDLGGSGHGKGSDATPADEVVAEIEANGGRAIVNGLDISKWATAEQLVAEAIEVFGRLDIVVNNAGFSRDGMAYKMSEDDWDAVVGVHMKGTFALCRFAAEHWRKEYKRSGQPVNAAILNTSSASGLFSSLAQANYVAAKAGVAAMTISLARELASAGVRANVVAPVAATRLLTMAVPDYVEVPSGQFDPLGVDQISPLVVWLCSDLASDISGQVFEVSGARIRLLKGWHQVSEVHSEGSAWSVQRINSLRQSILADEDTGPGTFDIDLG